MRKFSGILFILVILIGLFAPISSGFSINETLAQPASATTPSQPTDTVTITAPVEATGDTNCWFDMVCWLAYIFQGILSLFGFFLWVAGGLLNFVTQYFVVDMRSTMGNINSSLEIAWRTFRDIGNLVLVFGFLVIGIATILRSNSYGMKQLLAKLILVAILVNFSLFFTKLVVDATNLVAVNFYEQNIQGYLLSDTGGFVSSTEVGFSDMYMENLNLASLYVDAGAEWSFGQLFILFVGGIVLFGVTAFVFFAAALMLISRFMVLVLLMVLSPIAFVAYALPATTGYARQWWKMLVNNALFAPAFFILIWIVFQLIGRGIFQFTAQGTASWGQIFTGGSASIGLLINFILVIGLTVYALILSRQFGIFGAGTVLKWGGWAKKQGLGAAGGAAGFLPRRGLRATGTFARRQAARASYSLESRVLPTKKLPRWANVATLGAITGAQSAVREGLQATSKQFRDEIARQKKSLEGLRTGELKRRFITASKTEKAAIALKIAEAEDLKYLTDPADIDRLQQARQIIESAGMSTMPIDSQRLDIIAKYMKGDPEEMAKEWRDLFHDMKVENFRKMSDVTVAVEDLGEKVVEAIVKFADGGKFGATLASAGAASDKVFKYLKKQDSLRPDPDPDKNKWTPEDLVEYLKSVGNEKAATYMNTTAGRRLAFAPESPRKKGEGKNKGPGESKTNASENEGSAIRRGSQALMEDEGDEEE